MNNQAANAAFLANVNKPVRVPGGVGIQARLKTTGGGSDVANVRVKIRQ